MAGSVYDALLEDLTTINDALQLEAVDEEEEEAADQLMRRLLSRLVAHRSQHHHGDAPLAAHRS
jgi:hypothetical protein